VHVLLLSNSHQIIKEFFFFYFQQEQGGTGPHVTFAVGGRRKDGLACMRFLNYLQGTANDMGTHSRKRVPFEYHNKNI
jgi:hypothetical protein